MPTKQDIADRLADLTADIRADIVSTPPVVSGPSPTVYVQPGANLPDLVDQSSGSTRFVLAAGFAQDVREFRIGKPCQIIAERVPSGRATSSTAFPALRLGSMVIEAPGVVLRGLRLLATNRDSALVVAGPQSSNRRLRAGLRLAAEHDCARVERAVGELSGGDDSRLTPVTRRTDRGFGHSDRRAHP